MSAKTAVEHEAEHRVNGQLFSTRESCDLKCSLSAGISRCYFVLLSPGWILAISSTSSKQSSPVPVPPPPVTAVMFPGADTFRLDFLLPERMEDGGVRRARFAREQGREWLEILVVTTLQRASLIR